uniref:NADH-ubiquinone oxidoreductase chain 6 n=1 Tax=Chitala chitala TaxID=112163 RepID=A0A343CWX2_CHICT|nr:NADH dehydrogenase subunit 6 [Chitala chitala]ARO75733.1 NADH dehydrogenase subunit 6 [Chitala chitala]WAS32731.1 NADH dehydrogenase subunit 6 [Chitala chitala]
MAILFSMLLIGLLLGLVAVASNPAPYFAALGLVLAAAVGCGILVGCGGSFLSFVLFLIYLGGMLVVFAYSAALAAEPYPDSWGDWSVFGYVFFYVLGLLFLGLVVSGTWYLGSWFFVDELKEFSIFRGDFSGVALMYSSGGVMLVIWGWVLLLTLFVVLELTRVLSREALRAI